MYRHLILALFVTLLLNFSSIALANQKKVSSGVYRQTILNDITDSLATMGKSSQQATAIRRQRRMARTKARQQKIYAKNHRNIIRH